MTNPKEAQGGGKFWISLASFTLALTAAVASLIIFVVDAKISEARVGIVDDMRPILEELKMHSQGIDRRVSVLEGNVTDRWTATEMYQWSMELTEELRRMNPDFPRLDPYAVKRRRTSP